MSDTYSSSLMQTDHVLAKQMLYYISHVHVALKAFLFKWSFVFGTTLVQSWR